MTGLDRAAEVLADAVDDALGEVACAIEIGIEDSARVHFACTRPFADLDDPYFVGLALGLADLADFRGEARFDPTLAELLSGITYPTLDTP
jgi:hypothetical protein